MVVGFYLKLFAVSTFLLNDNGVTWATISSFVCLNRFLTGQIACFKGNCFIIIIHLIKIRR